MAEFALAAGIIEVAALGIKLARELYDFSADVSSASAQLEYVANNVSLYCDVLKAVGRHLQLNHSDHTREAEDVALEVQRQSESIFQKIKQLLPKTRANGRISGVQKLAWSFRKNRVEYLVSQLECLKSTMGLLLHILTSTPKLKDYMSTTDPSLTLKEEAAVEILEGKNKLFEHCTAYSRAKAAESVHDEFVVLRSEDLNFSEDDAITHEHLTSSAHQLVLSRSFSSALVSIHAKISSATPTELRQLTLSNSSLWLSQLYLAWANAETQKDLTVLVNRSKSFHETEIQLELKRHERGFATFSQLWLLFKPESTVFTRVGGQLMFFKVLTISRAVGATGVSKPWSINVWNFCFDGYFLRRKARCFWIHEFHAEREIQKLPIRPIEYLHPEEGIKADYIVRGQYYYEIACTAPLCRSYNGPVNGDNEDRYVGDVVVDPAGYAKDSSSSPTRQNDNTSENLLGRLFANDESSMDIEDPADFGDGPHAKLDGLRCLASTQLHNEEYYLLLPGHIQGYALDRKQWLIFELVAFVPFDDDHRPWEDIVIDDRCLQLVQSFAMRLDVGHGIPAPGSFIPGKGHSQVVLLYGPPGVGKTMTVECVARQTERPLLRLTSTDIGTAEMSIATNIANYLDLAARWAAIILIDDAEILLGLDNHYPGSKIRVTEFIRALEYYDGVVFLTTSEPGQISDTVTSHINFAIEYRALGKEMRGQLWLKLIRQLHDQQAAPSWPKEIGKIVVDESTQHYLTSETMMTSDIEVLNLNGRDINNAFQTALKLARCDALLGARMADRPHPKSIRVKPAHFETVLKTKLHLKRTLNGIHGRSEAQRAMDDGARRESDTSPL